MYEPYKFYPRLNKPRFYRFRDWLHKYFGLELIILLIIAGLIWYVWRTI
jgi:hypothetical protein